MAHPVSREVSGNSSVKVEGYPSVRYRMLVTRERYIDGAVDGVNTADGLISRDGSGAVGG